MVDWSGARQIILQISRMPLGRSVQSNAEQFSPGCCMAALSRARQSTSLHAAARYIVLSRATQSSSRSLQAFTQYLCLEQCRIASTIRLVFRISCNGKARSKENVTRIQECYHKTHVHRAQYPQSLKKKIFPSGRKQHESPTKMVLNAKLADHTKQVSLLVHMRNINTRENGGRAHGTAQVQNLTQCNSSHANCAYLQCTEYCQMCRGHFYRHGVPIGARHLTSTDITEPLAQPGPGTHN